MKTKISQLLLFVITGLLGLSAQALVIFQDNFNSENGGVNGLNYSSFANWTVSHGTVDVVNDNSNPWIPNNIGDGIYVDLDGSTGDAGRMRTNDRFFFEAGTNYRLSFDLAGNNRNAGADGVRNLVTSIGVPNHQFVNETIFLNASTGFTTFSYDFTGLDAFGRIIFDARHGQISNQDDNIGLLLDNVVLETVSVSEPGSLALLGLGLLGLAMSRRRYQQS